MPSPESASTSVTVNENETHPLGSTSASATVNENETRPLESSSPLVTVIENEMPPEESTSLFVQISDKTGLPKSYYQSLGPNTSNVSSSFNIAPIDQNLTPVMSAISWFLIPKGLTDELTTLPWEHVVGQGVLVRDCKNHTALVSIAQAAVAQLNNLAQLLESLISIIDESMRLYANEGRHRFYEISWNYRNYLPTKAIATFSRTENGAWIMGLEGNSLPQRQLQLDAVYVLEWVRSVFFSRDAQVSDDNLIVSSPAADAWRTCNTTLDNETLVAELGFPSASLTAYEAGVVTSEVDPRGSGCWRKKIQGGVVLACRRDAASNYSFQPPVDANEDGLVLTAAALWALFDDKLTPMPNCTCTFRSEGGDFLRCQGKVNDWYVWHLEIEEKEICGGKRCKGNGIVTSNGDLMLPRQSPCILGWPAAIRSSPSIPIAKKVKLSARFVGNVCTSASFESAQVQAQVGWQGMSGLVGVTFKMKQYKVANSVKSGSTLASLLSELATVLIYCEERGIHLAMHGADVIETLCMQRLNDLLWSGSIDRPESSVVNIYNEEAHHLPRFVHSRAVERMATWRTSTFTTHSGFLSGEELVEDASKRVLELMKATKSITKRPLYWSLQDLLSGKECAGLKGPLNLDGIGWFRLWREYPFLIIAVGRIEDTLISTGSESVPLKWSPRKRSNSITNRLGRYIHPPVVILSGGLVAENRLIRALLQQSSGVFPATLTKSELLLPGKPDQPCFEIAEKKHDDVEAEMNVVCSNCHYVSLSRSPTECLHYFL